MKRTVLILLIVWMFGGAAAWSREKEGGALAMREELLAIDGELSGEAARSGVLKALLPRLTEESAVFPVSGWPLMGANACKNALSATEDGKPETRIEWVPLFALISEDGLLGYTYGRFELPYDDGEEHEAGIPHYYGTIWKRTAGSGWTVALSQGLVFLGKNVGTRPDNRLQPEKACAFCRRVAETEAAFARTALEKNIPQAFFEYIDVNGVALGQSGEPRTKDTYALAAEKAKTTNSPDPKPLLEWTPYYCFAASSNDLAYDYGPAAYTVTTADGQAKKYHGYFFTLWKRQADGSLRFVFDAGNECPPPPGEKLE